MDRVLLVEDDFITNLALRECLEGAGFEVEPAFSGQGALAVIKRRPPRSLVTDLNLGPGPDGFEVARYARTVRPDVRVVFVSSERGRAEDVDTFGDAAFIAKPCRGEQIVQALRSPPVLAAA